MGEWLIEAGVGEKRAILIEAGAIVAARIERYASAPRVGAVVAARLVEAQAKTGGIVRFDDGSEAMLAKVPRSVSIGAEFRVAVVREALPEPRKVKRAVVRAAVDEALQAGPILFERVAEGAHKVTLCDPRVGEDRFVAAGWDELRDEATSGEIAFPGGALRISPTPAMTLIDIDGAPGDAFALAKAGAVAASQAIVRLDIAGSIGIDLPTVAGRAERTALGEAIDAALPPPFERTAINGFGFVQIVRPRTHASLIERAHFQPIEWAALGLLRRAERAHGAGPASLVAAPKVAAWLDERSDLIAELSRRLGRKVTVAMNEHEAMDGGYVA